MTDPRDPFDEWLAARPVEPLSPQPGDFERISRSARRRRWLKTTGVAATVLILATGAAGLVRTLPVSHEVEPGPTAAAPTSAAPSPVPTRSPASSQSSHSPAAGSSPSAKPSPGRCTSGQLRVSVGVTDSPSGHLGKLIVFTNASGRACTMYGHPGVSFLTSSGTQVNVPAQWTGRPSAPVTVPPGGTAQAVLLLVNVTNYPPDQCTAVPVARVRVYPPDQTTPLYAPAALQVCSVNGAGIARIYPVVPHP